MSIVLDMPMTQQKTASVAYDYAGRKDGVLSGGTKFDNGLKGNALTFDGGDCTVPAVAVTGDFTLMCMLLSGKIGSAPAPTQIILSVKYGSTTTTQAITAQALMWHRVAIAKSGYQVTMYVGGQSVTIQAGSGITNISVLQDNVEAAEGKLFAVQVRNTALSVSDINQYFENIMSEVQYFFDGVSFSDYSVYVSASSGLLDVLKPKTPTKTDWADDHGEIVDLSRQRFEPRSITLTCFLEASNQLDFATKVQEFVSKFYKSGSHRLRVVIDQYQPLEYEVFLSDGATLDKTWSNVKMGGSFQLRLEEPEPIKKVLKYTRSGTGQQQITVSFHTDSAINIYWGDGTEPTRDCLGDVTATHTYTADGDYYPIVAGDIDSLTGFTTNGIVVWEKI